MLVWSLRKSVTISIVRRQKKLQLILILVVSLSLLAACGGSTKKPNVPIPTVVAVLEKPYTDLETQPLPTEEPTEAPTPDPNFTPGTALPTSETTPPVPIATPNLTATAPIGATATPFPTPTTGTYPIGGVPTVSFSTPVDSYPVVTPTSTLPAPTPNNGLPAGLVSGSAVYTIINETKKLENESFTGAFSDQSAIWARNTSQLVLVLPELNCSGQSSSLLNSINSGLNACLLSMEGSTISISGGNVTTLGSGSSGLYALGNASRIVADEVTVTTAGDSARGASAENGGTLNLSDTSLTTVGPNAAGIAINLGGSNAMLTNTVITTGGLAAPCYYTNVTLRTQGGSCNAAQSEAAIIENDGVLELRQTSLTSRALTRWGILLYQSTSRDAGTAEAEFDMQGGSLSVTDANSPAFFVTNVNAAISLSGVNVTTASGVVLKAGAQNTWGTAGENGGTVSLFLTGQNLKGDIQTDRLSSVVIQMRSNSNFEGAINTADTARVLALDLDTTSSWTLTRNSYVPQITGAVLDNNRVLNIIGNNFNVYYDPLLSSGLGGNTYQLTGGGVLTPHP